MRGEGGQNSLHFQVLPLAGVKVPICKQKNVHKDLTGHQSQNPLIKILVFYPNTMRSLWSIVLIFTKVGIGSQVNL
jgi:hypothetical protein